MCKLYLLWPANITFIFPFFSQNSQPDIVLGFFNTKWGSFSFLFYKRCSYKKYCDIDPKTTYFEHIYVPSSLNMFLKKSKILTYNPPLDKQSKKFQGGELYFFSFCSCIFFFDLFWYENILAPEKLKYSRNKRCLICCLFLITEARKKSNGKKLKEQKSKRKKV